MAEKPKVVSFDPDTFVAGGLIDNIDAEVESAEFTKEGPENYTESALFLKLSLKDMLNGDVHDQYWSAGKKAFDEFEVSPDGFQAIATGTSSFFIRDSNFWVFMENLKKKGFPAAKMENLSNLRGLQMHMVRIPEKERAGLTRDKDDRPRTVLVCERILKMPGEKAKPAARAAARPAAAAAAPTAAPAAAPAAAPETSSDEYTPQATDLLAELLSKGEAIELKFVRTKGFQILNAKKVASADRTAILKLATDPAWIESAGFLYDPDTQSVVPSA